MIRCPKCDKEVPEDSKFCKACGAKIMTSEEKQKSTKKKLIAIIAVLLAIIIGLSGFIVFDKVINKPDVVTKDNTDKQPLNNSPVTPNGNSNQANKDIYKAPNGKYYIPTKITTYSNQYDDKGGYTENTFTQDVKWTSNSVEFAPYLWWLCEFNDNGKITSKKTYWDSELSEMEGKYEYRYDANGKLILEGNDYEFNEKGYLIKETFKPDSPDSITPERITTYTYDSQNRCTNIRTTYGVFSQEFKIRYNNDKSITFDIIQKDGTETAKYSFTAFYDEYNKISSLTTSENQKCTFTYDENRNLRKIDITGGVLEDGNPAFNRFEIEWAEGTKAQAIFANTVITETVTYSGNMYLFSYYYPTDIVTKYLMY